MSKKIGVLLINLGSPASPEPKSVKAYLQEFLMDDRVIDVPIFLRRLIVHGFILPFRSKKSSKAYKKIWTPDGSPLLHHTRNFTHKLQKTLPESLRVKWAMRYGEPSLATQLKEWRERDFHRFLIFPLYPQYASSTTGSAIEHLFKELSSTWNIPELQIQTIPPFYNEGIYIAALGKICTDYLKDKTWDHLLMSFHGLPVKHIKKSECLPGYCMKKKYACCEKISWENHYCYRAQCVTSAHSLAEKMHLRKEQYTISFQSRLGKDTWLEPYTTQTVQQLAQQGVKNLAVVCPSFVADCLETVEEIGMQTEKVFKQAGGENLRLIPCLNDSDIWVQAAKELILRHTQNYS